MAAPADAKDAGVKVEIRLGLRSVEKYGGSYFLVVSLLSRAQARYPRRREGAAHGRRQSARVRACPRRAVHSTRPRRDCVCVFIS